MMLLYTLLHNLNSVTHYNVVIAACQFRAAELEQILIFLRAGSMGGFPLAASNRYGEPRVTSQVFVYVPSQIRNESGYGLSLLLTQTLNSVSFYSLKTILLSLICSDSLILKFILFEKIFEPML